VRDARRRDASSGSPMYPKQGSRILLGCKTQAPPNFCPSHVRNDDTIRTGPLKMSLRTSHKRSVFCVYIRIYQIVSFSFYILAHLRELDGKTRRFNSDLDPLPTARYSQARSSNIQSQEAEIYFKDAETCKLEYREVYT
jgi:hypothetical protein